MSLELRPLTPHVGIEVAGVDLRQPLEPAQVVAIRDAWERYGVLVFHDQQISVEDQSRFANTFGELQPNRKGPRKGLEFINIANATVDGIEGNLGNGEMSFHQDASYAPNPGRQTMLYALEIPRAGGNTKFASTAAPYERLPADLRERLLGYDLHHSYGYQWVTRGETTADTPQCTHPLIIAYPPNGKPLLFCNRLMADHIVGLPRDEGDALITHLCDIIEAPENVYEHVWRVGDFVAWDNLLVQHARTDFDPNERRVLRRMQTVGPTTKAYRDTVLTEGRA